MPIKNEFQPNDRIFAKIPDYPEWPAKVIEQVESTDGSKQYKIFFYGRCEYGIVNADQMILYTEDSKAMYGNPPYFNGFKEAMEEFEKDPRIQEDEILLEEPEEAVHIAVPQRVVSVSPDITLLLLRSRLPPNGYH